MEAYYYETIEVAVPSTHGALVIYGKPYCRGWSVELHSAAGDSNLRNEPKQHAAFIERQGASGPVVAAVFPRVKPGNWFASGGGCDYVTVYAGEVAELDWRR